MKSYRVVAKIKRSFHHHPTGKTEHYQSGKLLPAPVFLEIVQYEGDSGFYLLYLSQAQEELTNTYHENLPSAFEQAQWEFQIQPQEWSVVS